MIEALLQLLLLAFLGGVVALIAHHRGRNPLAWFFLGAFFFCFAFILVLVLPDLKEQREREQQLVDENRRLKEQLRKDRMVADRRHEEVQRRLDAHDTALTIDTRRDEGSAMAAPRAMEPLDVGIPESTAGPWWFFQDEMRKGPFSFDQLRALWQGGTVNRETRVWTAGMSDWAPIESLPRLSEALDA